MHRSLHQFLVVGTHMVQAIVAITLLFMLATTGATSVSASPSATSAASAASPHDQTTTPPADVTTLPANVTTSPLPRPIGASELQGNIGAMVTLPIAGLQFVKDDFQIEDIHGQLFFSDNPEYIHGQGIAYKGTVSGNVRVYTYHANGDTQPKLFPTWLINRGDEPVHVTVTREAIGGPGVDYGYIGQYVLEDYFGHQTERAIVVPPGGRELIDPHLATYRAGHNALIHGIYDLIIEGELDIAVAGVYSLDTDPDTLPDLPRRQDGAGRGLFRTNERRLSFNVGDAATGVRIASGKENDPWVVGQDQIEQKENALAGNYGVIYHVNATVEVTSPKRVRFFMAPGFDGGGSCPMAPSIRLGTDTDHMVVRVPHDGHLAITRPEPAAFLGELIVTPDEPRVFTFDFMPPGGSCLPAAIIAWPVPLDGTMLLPIRGLDAALQPWDPPAAFHDDFNETSPYWSWSATLPIIKDGQAVWATKAYGNAFSGLADATDYALTLRAVFDEPGTLSMFLRSNRLWQGYTVVIDSSSQRVLVQRHHGTWDHNVVLGSQPLPKRLLPGTWFTARAQVQDNRITVFIDDAPILTVTDPDRYYDRGRVGFRIGYTPMRLDEATLELLPESGRRRD